MCSVFTMQEKESNMSWWGKRGENTLRSESARGCIEREKKEGLKWTQDVGNRHHSKRGQTGQH